ncbi:Protein of unknown function [Methylobacillus rhizosphaerae]|uniref:DUF2818 domain-containing protein n=1 Tax=Methylobacillus rhizosphaerae TaxID=551994 RepID=A0A239ALA9_9PROT|nr:DUF2818 family protein [Methylobacillus rhizosphaerae]SNR96339.1 Protein of unknown function [Methylobacillus rhizosphaerae]
MTITILLLLALLAANLPWGSERLFYLVPLKGAHKAIGWCLLELVVLYFVIGTVAVAVEQGSVGQVAARGWEFYAITFSLFLVFAFPGFVYRYLWRNA